MSACAHAYLCRVYAHAYARVCTSMHVRVLARAYTPMHTSVHVRVSAACLCASPCACCMHVACIVHVCCMAAHRDCSSSLRDHYFEFSAQSNIPSNILSNIPGSRDRTDTGIQVWLMHVYLLSASCLPHVYLLSTACPYEPVLVVTGGGS